MAYTVLARRYRSRTFDDLIGQEAVARTLKNAISSGRIAHGYLFCGTRGVGKTSTARILAKALNCLTADGPTPTPCLTCDSCTHIAAGDDIDCLEIDAASNTGVDNVRDLRNNASFRPARARFKIYIIDEVHMLSTAAFNALLKTLEEPPPHVKFILATTDPQKVPETVRSRVQRFDFRPIRTDDIARHFAEILKQENIGFDDSALRRVARMGNGSMRDGLSLLDQLLSLGEKLTDELIDTVLPNAATPAVTALVDAIAAGDVKRTLELGDDMVAAGQSPELVAAALLEHVRNLMVVCACGNDSSLIDAGQELRETLSRQAQQFDASACVYMISLLEDLRRSARASASGRALLDAALVRLADAVKFADLSRLLATLADARPAGPPNAGPPSSGSPSSGSLGPPGPPGGMVGAGAKKASGASVTVPRGADPTPASAAGTASPRPVAPTPLARPTPAATSTPAARSTPDRPMLGRSPPPLAREQITADVTPQATPAPPVGRPGDPDSIDIGPADAPLDDEAVPLSAMDDADGEEVVAEPTPPAKKLDRRDVLAHPLVRQAIELFQADVVDISDKPPP